MSVAIIGGTGLTSLPGLEIKRREVVHTPFGNPSEPITHGQYYGKDIAFLARHGYGHTIPPHRINYRANIWALKHLGIERVIAVAAVGGLSDRMAPRIIAFPDQIIDYTWARAHTFFEDDLTHVTHIDFTYPYDTKLRATLIEAAKRSGIDYVDGGTYGATQGPRLETAAEIRRLCQDGCELVGMTGMPEAVLARELELAYATCAVVANWGAGMHGGAEISLTELEETLKKGMESMARLLTQVVPLL